MKKNIFILVFVFAALIPALAQRKSYAAEMAKTAMTLWQDSLFVQPGRPVKWSHEQAVILKGIAGLWYATGDVSYFNYIQKSMDFFVDDKGSIRTYKQEEHNIDNITPGRALLLLYKVTGKEKYLNAVKTLRAQLNSQPRTNEGGFWHKKIYPNQMWLDGLYMAEPFYAEYAKTFNEDASFADIAHQFILMERKSRDVKTGLLYHGYDESREQKWADKVTGHSPNFWGRAMGWYGSALVDVLEVFPNDHKSKDTLIKILNRFATAVVKYQDKKSGLWWDIMNLPGKEKNYTEASASSLFVYTLAKAVRLGFLPKSFLPFAQKGYDGIIKNFIKVENGQANLYGTVSVSGLGGNPYRDGSYDYYMSEKVVMNDAKGIGAFIQAANEIDMLSTLSLGKNKTVLLDYYFNHETRIESGKPVRFHYLWEEEDNNGYSFFGKIFNRYGVQTGSLDVAPTSQNLKNAGIYIIVDPDTTSENKSPNYIQPADVEAINTWVKAGGVLILLGNDSPNVEFTHFNRLAARFGIQFNYDSKNRVTGNKFEMGAVPVSPENSVFKTAGKVYIKEFASQKLSGSAKVVLINNKNIVVSISKVGKGIVLAAGDPWFYNEYTDGRKLPKDFENYKAAEDLVKWAISNVK